MKPDFEINLLKNKEMKTTNDIFAAFVLSSEEMICVRGGEGDVKTIVPPIVI